MFGQNGPRMGSYNPWGFAYMARIVGEKKAREMWFLCRRYTAQDALEMGLVNNPDVADGKAVAMPDRAFGETACAYLIMRPGRALLSVKQLGDFLVAQGLAKVKLPERIECFPVTRVGKVDKTALREIVADKLARETAVSTSKSR